MYRCTRQYAHQSAHRSLFGRAIDAMGRGTPGNAQAVLPSANRPLCREHDNRSSAIRRPEVVASQAPGNCFIERMQAAERAETHCGRDVLRRLVIAITNLFPKAGHPSQQPSFDLDSVAIQADASGGKASRRSRTRLLTRCLRVGRETKQQQ